MIKFLLKPRSKMAEFKNGKKQYVKRVKLLKYMVTSHAQNKIVERNIPKFLVIEHLIRKPIGLGKVQYNTKKEPGYSRYTTKLRSVINPNNHNIVSIRMFKENDFIKDTGRKFTKKESKIYELFHKKTKKKNGRR